VADNKNRTQQKAPHGRAKAYMTGKRALAFTLSVLLAWMLAMPSVTSATTDDGTGAEEVAAATTQEEGSVSSKAADTDSSAAAAADASANDSSAAASGSASETSADSKTSSSDTAQNSAATSENVSGGSSKAGSDDASTSEESSSVAEESAAKAAPALEDTNSATEVSGEEGLSVATNSGTYRLSGDVYQTSTVKIAGNTTVDLNGWHVYYKGSTQLFDVEGGTLTITDSNPATDTPTKDTGSEAGTAKVGSITYNGSAPKNITYYVTESEVNPDGISTTETRWQHTVTPGGFITAEAQNGADSVICMESGTLNIQGGTICMPYSASHGTDCHIIYAEGGTFNLSGGYIAGGKRTSNWGGGVCLAGSATLNMSGGVITANEAKAGAGVYAAQGTTVNMTNDKAVISGNTVVAGTYGWSDSASDGYGGGIYALGATVNVSGGYITNNRVNASYKDRHQGLIGGGGIAIMNDSSQASLAISGGYITENYSKEAGGGIYAGRYKKGLGEHFTLTGGTIASNVAQNSEGGGIRISEGTTANFSVASGSHAYITNNYCNSQDDWGGGGVFVQKDGYLYVKNSLVTDNASGGYGAGVAACPTGETVVTHTSGAAIYGNKDDVDINGQDISPHFSTVNDYGKHEDYDVASIDTVFTSHGHDDYFLVREKSSDSYVTVVTGRMLGGGAAGWSGSVDGKEVKKVDANSGIEAKYLVGMTAHPTDSAKAAGVSAATLIFSGNYAYNHGGGIMTNGGVTLGDVKNIDIYPGLSFNAKKSLTQDGASAQLTDDEYTFVLLSPASSTSAAPSWNSDGTLNYGGCTESVRTKNDANGNIHFNVSSEYSQAGEYRYYVAEIPNSGDTTTKTYDKTIYRIDADIREDTSQRTTLLGITFKHYTISNLRVTPITNGVDGTPYKPSTTTADSITSFTLTKDGDTNNKAAFSNELKPYETTGSFTPEVTKHVEGGEVKEFTFQLFDADGYNGGKWDGAPLQTKTTEKSDSSDATVTFNTIPYKLGVSDLTGGKGGTKTYDYYIREKSGSDNGYTYDGGYIQVHVTVTDDRNGSLTVDHVYTYVDKGGNQYKDQAKFDNKYATSLPNAGQAGIALVYVAGGAALAYGLWRLIRSRHESRKGGDER
jgi:pilin isopeptide linkage protein